MYVVQSVQEGALPVTHVNINNALKKSTFLFFQTL